MKVKGGVKNINKETGKATSKKPMTKMNAEKQKKAIAISEKKKKDPKEKKSDMKEKEKPKKDMKKENGLTEKQKKLPKKLQEAIMKKKAKK